MAHLTKKQLTELRDKLEAARAEAQELLDITSDGARATDPGEPLGDGYSASQADRGTDLFSREQSLGQAEDYQVRLDEIQRAVEKMDDGTYGISEGNGDPIPFGRLMARPWARLTVEEESERPFVPPTV